MVLETLDKHTLFAKKSKCKLGCAEIDYLDHLVSTEGVKAYFLKLKAMVEWPLPKSIKSLRGFLGLIGYYRKFIKKLWTYCCTFNCFTKKNAFCWSEEAFAAFEALKQAMISPPVLTLLHFERSFIIECDASGLGVGTVLMQGGRPLAYLSQALKGKALDLSTYEKKLLALVYAIKTMEIIPIGKNLLY